MSSAEKRLSMSAIGADDLWRPLRRPEFCFVVPVKDRAAEWQIFQIVSFSLMTEPCYYRLP